MELLQIRPGLPLVRQLGHALMTFVYCVLVITSAQAARAEQLSPKLEPERFSTTNGLPSDRVLCVTVDGDRVWAGTDNGLALIEDGRVIKVYQSQDGLPSNVVTALAVAHDTGELWIATYGGISRYSAGRFQNYTDLSSGLANDIVYDIAIEKDTVWAATAAGLSRFSPRAGTWETFDGRNSPLSDPWPTAIAVSLGKVDVATWGMGAIEYASTPGKWISIWKYQEENRSAGSVVKNAALNFTVGAVYDPRSAVLWIATRGGLVKKTADGWRLFSSSNSGLASNLINSIRLYDGKLWIGTTAGLSVLDVISGRWTTYRPAGSPSVSGPFSGKAAAAQPLTDGGNNVFSVAFDGRYIWIASESGLAAGKISSAGQIENVRRDSSVANTVATKWPSPGMTVTRMADRATINIGFFGPIEGAANVQYGLSMLHGAQLAIDEANQRASSSTLDKGREWRYELEVHNDSALWGASTTEPVSMALDEHVVAILGTVDGGVTHTLLRIATELGIPVVNTGSTDDSIAETGSPWLVHLLPDDRQQSLALVRYIDGQQNLHRVGILDEDARYARQGVDVLRQSLEHARYKVVEAKFHSGDRDLSQQIRLLREVGIDAVILWCRPDDGARILKQMRNSGLIVPVLGSSELASTQIIEQAGSAAEGFVVPILLDPTRPGARWRQFRDDYFRKFREYPDAYASYAYDGINLIIACIEEVGVDRSKIAEALRQYLVNSIEGASGKMAFDTKLGNVAPITMSRVEDGKFVYWIPGGPTMNSTQDAIR